jgi:hypothetical protein
MTLVGKCSKPLQSIAWPHFFFFLRQTTWTMASHAGRFDGCYLHICATTVVLAAANAMLAERIATKPRPPFVN